MEGGIELERGECRYKWLPYRRTTTFLSVKVAKQNGIDISRQRSRRFTASDLEDYDLVYAMAADVMEEMKHISRNKFDAKKVKLFLDEMYPGEDRDVPDPWYGPEPGYHEVYKIISDACDHIVKKYSNKER